AGAQADFVPIVRIDKRAIEYRQMRNDAQRIESRVKGRIRRLFAAVQIANEPAFAEGVMDEFVILIKRSNRVVGPVVATPLDDDVQVKRERHAFAQDGARAIRQIEVNRGVELVDVFGRLDVSGTDFEAGLRPAGGE